MGKVLGVLAGVGVLGGLLLLAFGGTMFDLKMKEFFAPKYEQVRRDVYEESWSYNRGKVEHLNRLRLEYVASDNKNHKAVLRQVILNEVAAYDRDRLPDDLQAFVREIE